MIKMAPPTMPAKSDEVTGGATGAETAGAGAIDAFAASAKNSGRGAGAQPGRRQMAMRVYKIITEAPDDGSGMVPGTPFSESGVAKLMRKLRERAAAEGANGAKAAAGILNFLAPQGGKGDKVAGASVEKLQLVARIAAKFKRGDTK